mmetsp:Transcript_4842/g.6808  ORF Transcript_4842/g.6808 Transcript_4842/m.6808 type:complete len:115 (+) Transcript_4842:83-427(+)
MMGLLRIVSRGAAPQLPRTVVNTPATSLPFIPTDWVFRFMPWISRDRVRFLLRFNQISFVFGFGFILFFAHTPYGGAGYDHLWKSPLYNWKYTQLEKTGELEDNLKIKRKHFYE